MNKQQIIEILKNFTFSDEEADIYVSALSLEKPTVTQLAHKTNKSRTATYFHVKKLVEKGILREIKGGKTARYAPKAPTELASIFDRLTTDFKGLVPALSALKQTEGAQPIIEVLQSKKGYYEVYDEISALPHGSYFMVVEGSEAAKSELSLLTSAQWQQFFTRIAERKIMTKALFTEELLRAPMELLEKESLELMGTRIWNIHTLPEEKFPFQHLFFIYGNKIAILFPKEELVIKIQHEGITEIFKLLFNTLYNLARPIANPWAHT